MPRPGAKLVPGVFSFFLFKYLIFQLGSDSKGKLTIAFIFQVGSDSKGKPTIATSGNNPFCGKTCWLGLAGSFEDAYCVFVLVFCFLLLRFLGGRRGEEGGCRLNSTKRGGILCDVNAHE